MRSEYHTNVRVTIPTEEGEHVLRVDGEVLRDTDPTGRCIDVQVDEACHEETGEPVSQEFFGRYEEEIADALVNYHEAPPEPEWYDRGPKPGYRPPSL